MSSRMDQNPPDSGEEGIRYIQHISSLSKQYHTNFVPWCTPFQITSVANTDIVSTLQVWSSKLQRHRRARQPPRKLLLSPTRQPSGGVEVSTGSAKGRPSPTRRPASTRASSLTKTLTLPGPKTIPASTSHRGSYSRDMGEYVQRWRGCHRVGFGSRIIHQSLPTGPTKCNLCHKSRHGVIVFKIDSKKWM